MAEVLQQYPPLNICSIFFGSLPLPRNECEIHNILDYLVGWCKKHHIGTNQETNPPTKGV